jgi:hypothetical protein
VHVHGHVLLPYLHALELDIVCDKCARVRYLRNVVVSCVADQGASGEQAKRVQIPLELGWNFSVHRSQGMSLDRVEMSLRNVFEYGQVCASRYVHTCVFCILVDHDHACVPK